MPIAKEIQAFANSEGPTSVLFVGSRGGCGESYP